MNSAERNAREIADGIRFEAVLDPEDPRWTITTFRTPSNPASITGGKLLPPLEGVKPEKKSGQSALLAIVLFCRSVVPSQ